MTWWAHQGSETLKSTPHGRATRWQSWGESPGLCDSGPGSLLSVWAGARVERVRIGFCPGWVLPPEAAGSRQLCMWVRGGGGNVPALSTRYGEGSTARHSPYLQQSGGPGAVAKVLDDGDVASQAPVYTAALVTHQHTPADGGPAGVCRVGVRVSRSQTRARPPEHRPGPALRLELHAHLLTQSPKALGAGPAMRTLSSGGGRDSHQSQALSYMSLPLWGGVVPRAYSAGKASCPTATATSSTAFPQGTRLPP